MSSLPSASSDLSERSGRILVLGQGVKEACWVEQWEQWSFEASPQKEEGKK
jgi:hypothetical protein